MPGTSISMSQGFALHELDTEAGLSQRDLADRLQLEKSTVSRMVAQMENQGLVVRERDAGNRRYYRIHLTAKGRALHSRMRRTAHRQYEQWVAAISPEEREALQTGLSALVGAIHGEPGTIPGGNPRRSS